jgi:hypothetical protein
MVELVVEKEYCFGFAALYQALLGVGCRAALSRIMILH